MIWQYSIVNVLKTHHHSDSEAYDRHATTVTVIKSKLKEIQILRTHNFVQIMEFQMITAE